MVHALIAFSAQGVSCPPLNDWWGNALKQMQSKNIVVKDAAGARGKEGIKYTLTFAGVSIAEGLFWNKDKAGDSSEGMLCICTLILWLASVTLILTRC